MKNTQHFLKNIGQGAAVIAGIAAFTGAASADPPVSMAPPVGTAVSTGIAGNDTAGNTAPANVFNYMEIPANQNVPLSRVVFDQGGYQLFDTAGETIVVPFTNQNLYVMQFAVSPNRTMFFVNNNGTPTLYVPQNGYLENATVPGAKWYPFSLKFHPATPVFLGIAPSYREYVDFGWYPRTVIYGGYYSERPFFAGAIFAPSFGLSFVIGGRPYCGWHEYHDYVVYHPAPYQINYYNKTVYNVVNVRGPRDGHDFHGYSGYRDGDSRAYRRGYPSGGSSAYHGIPGGGHGSFSAATPVNRVFRGSGAHYASSTAGVPGVRSVPPSGGAPVSSRVGHSGGAATPTPTAGGARVFRGGDAHRSFGGGVPSSASVTRAQSVRSDNHYGGGRSVSQSSRGARGGHSGGDTGRGAHNDSGRGGRDGGHYEGGGRHGGR